MKTYIRSHKMAHSSHSKGSVSVDLFNLPTLPDERRVATSYLDIPVDFYLPEGKNSKISKIVSRQAFDRQTPDGNEGFVIEIQYLERAFSTNTYIIDKVTGSLFALHDDHIESTGLCGSECVFDLQELEFHICDLADRRNGEDDTGSIAEERWTTQAPQHQTPDAPPSPGPQTIPDNFPMYEEWENLTHQGVSFTISYRQKIYEVHSEIITTLIDCFSELNKHMSSHPETELACHQEKTHHFSYYSWLIQHIDNVLQEDNIFRCSNELPELPVLTYSPSVSDLEMIHRIHVMSHAWRESDHALQEATVIHREFMLEKAHMNNTSFSRIRNVENITDMGYSLNRVSPIFGEQQTPVQSTNPRNPMSTPRHKMGQPNKHSFIPQGADAQHEGRASPYDPDRSVENHLRGEAAGPDNETHGAQAPTTNTNNTNSQIPFQNPQRSVPNTTGPAISGGNRYSQPPNKGLGKKAPKQNNTQPSVSDIFALTRTHGAQAPTTNTNNTNSQIPFQNPQRSVPNTTGPAISGGNRYSQPPNKGLGKKAPKQNNTQPSVSDIFALTRTHGAQAPTTNTNNTNSQIPFQNPQRSVPNTTGPAISGGNRYSQPPNKGLGKKAPKQNNTQPSVSDIFALTRTHGAQAPTTNTNNTNSQIPFQNPQRSVPNTTGPAISGGNRYSQPPNKGPGKKAPKQNNTQPSISDIFA